MKMRRRKSSALLSLKRVKSQGDAKLFSAIKLRGGQKRASPRPVGKATRDSHGKKRPTFLFRGSLESLASNSSISDEEDSYSINELGKSCDEVYSALSRWKLPPTNALPPKVDLNNNQELEKNDRSVPKRDEKLVCGRVKVDHAGPKEADRATCEIYCYGPLLEAAQDAYIYNDSKSFVDMEMNEDPDTVLQDFVDLQNSTHDNPSKSEVVEFVNKHFSPPGSEFEEWVPEDWKKSPAFLNKITDAKLRSWATDLNELWKVLGRKIADDVKTNSSRYSIIYSPNPIIVPGGRFREFYYWDNYWIIRGLLLSEMYSTVKNSIRNFLGMVDQFGFVPNGGRIYYTRRSQPPFLTLMVREYVTASGDVDFIAEALPTLKKEYDFWINNRSVDVKDADGKTHILSRYASDVNQPRPESYREDAELIEGLEEVAQLELMSHITSACESGWDFSSRWTGSCYMCTPASLLRDLRTRDIIPVDLNSILAAVERTLADFHSQLGDDVKADQFTTAYNARVEAIEKILWNQDDNIYYDYLISQKSHNRQFFASNVNPLWTKCFPPTVNVEEREQKLYDYLQKTKVLDYPGGIPTSLNNSGQQWDFPNAWPPLVHMIIEGMSSSSLPELQEEGLKQAQKWITVNWRAFDKTSAMFEKYDVTRDDGVPGGGGEYDVQKGFGWTNGVIISLLNEYGEQLTAEPNLASTSAPQENTTSGAWRTFDVSTALAIGAAVTSIAGALP